MNKVRKIRNVKRKAYLGSVGTQRKKFCTEYQRASAQILDKMYKTFVVGLTQKGKRISCKKGCTYCCFQHISVPLAHGIVIVDYLYSNDKVMKIFLSNYGQWQDAAGTIPKEFDAKYISAVKTSDPNVLLTLHGDYLTSRYFNMQIACPFLVKSTCSIYAVRPMCCASHYSTDPCEWCSPTNTNHPVTYEVMPSDDDLYKLASLAGPQLSIYQATMPSLVYNILTEGLPSVLNKF